MKKIRAGQNFRSKVFRFLWITDPWDYLSHAADTSLRLAEEAEKLGYESHWADVRSIRCESGSNGAAAVVLDARRLIFPASGGTPEREPSVTRSPSEFDSIQWRMDPVVDATYLHPLMLLTLALRTGQKTKTEIVNPACVLHGMNEKLEPFGFGRPPRSLVSSQWEKLNHFGETLGRAVIKPLDLCQSKGIALLKWDSPAAREHAHGYAAKLTENFRRPVLVQEYLEEIKNGELRAWFLDGKLLAMARKFPLSGDFRVNIDQGSRMERATLNAKEKTTLRAVAQHLKKTKIRLAAIDLIGPYVTDFNFTSPGLLRELERLNGKNLARPIIKALVRK